MDVDVDNFDQAVELLERHLPQAAYVAIDLEMTGIVGSADTQVSSGDTPPEQYSKACAVVQRPYQIVQVGLCLFEQKSAGQWECRPFNFFVFPQPLNEKDAEGRQVAKTDPFLGLSASTALFLRSNGLDFNRWITKGVSYTRSAMEATLLKLLLHSRHSPLEDANSDGGPAKRQAAEPSKPQDIKFVEETMENVDKFVADGRQEMKFPHMNAFLALVIRQKIQWKYPKLVVEKRPSEANPNWQERWLLHLDEEGLRKRDAARKTHVMSLIGFRRVWSLLKVCKKPLVFHNGFFDLLFLVSAFEEDLPQALMDFKGLVHKSFPRVYDTKILADCPDVSGKLGSRSALPELASGLDARLASARDTKEAHDAAQPAEGIGGTCESSIVIADSIVFSLPDGFHRYASSANNCEGMVGFHCAGYDAYQTGRIFVYFHTLLGELKTSAFANQIFLMWSSFRLNLAGSMDVVSVGGIGRFVHNVDTKFLNNRTFLELLATVLGDGQRRVDLRWCSDNHSLLLILHGRDTESSSAGRDACEKCLDEVLQKLKDQGRLDFCTLDEHCRAKARVAEVRIRDGEDMTRPNKRSRAM